MRCCPSADAVVPEKDESLAKLLACFLSSMAGPARLGPVLLDELLGATEGQCTSGDILGQGRSGSHGHIGPQGDRRDQNGVGSGFAASTNHGPVFVDAVVVGGDGPCANVHLFTELRIADVAEVVDLAPGGDLALLDFDEVADPAIPGQFGPRPELGVGANRAAISDDRITHDGVEDLHLFANAGVF